MLSIELWQLVTLLLSLASIFTAIAKVLLVQVQRSLDQRFRSMEQQSEAWVNLEREFLRFQATIAVEYVRREDYVRGQSVIEAKLDAIASEVKRVQIDSVKQGMTR